MFLFLPVNLSSSMYSDSKPSNKSEASEHGFGPNGVSVLDDNINTLPPEGESYLKYSSISVQMFF